MKTSTPKPNKIDTKVPASVQPEITKKDLVTVFIDPEMVGKSGIRINDVMYVGHVKVPQDIGDELLRIQEEYWETVKKMKDPSVVVRMKNDYQKEKLFLADPSTNAGKKGWTRDYGLLPQREFIFCAPTFQQHLLELRKQLYGY